MALLCRKSGSVMRAVRSSATTTRCVQSGMCSSRVTPRRPTCFGPTSFHLFCSTTNTHSQLQDEINCVEKHTQGLHVPKRFPFTIVDNPGEETIILMREFDRESIEVLVYMPDMVRGNDDQCNGNDRSQPNIPFNATVVKDDGHRMEFYCRLSSNDVKIDKVQLKGPEDACHEDSYVGPDFPHLDKKVERMFVEYLEMRGIETSLASFLQDYMTKKYSKEYAMWSERLKEILQSDPSLNLNTSHQKV